MRSVIVLALVLVALVAALRAGDPVVTPSAAQTAAPCPAPAGPWVPIPKLHEWKANMVTFGKSNGDAIVAHQNDDPVDPALAMTYYDAIRVYHEIATYTQDTMPWTKYIEAAKNVYRDRYVVKNQGAVPGFWNFTTGLRVDFDRGGDASSRSAVLLIAQKAAYAADGTPASYTANMNRMREVAYTIVSYLDAGALGDRQRQRKALLVDQAYDHLNQFVSEAWAGTPTQASPFMAALTAHALIRDWQTTMDRRLIPALTRLADYLWANAWVAGDESMLYQLNPLDVEEGGRSTQGTPDLNLLIAPLYAFLAKATGEVKYREQGDALFAGGVTRAFLGLNKQFNQNYWWSFDYVAWRSS